MKKLIYAVILAVMCFIGSSEVYAMSGRLDKIDMIYKTYNTNGYNTYTRNSSYKLYIDDILTYCITPGVTFREGEGYYEGTYDNISQNDLYKMQLISYYGYNYSYHTSIEYYLATQELIHNVLGYTTIYNDGYFNVDYYKDEINRLVSRHDVLPTIDDDIYVVPNRISTFIDENWVLGDYIIEASPNVSYSISAKEFTVYLFDENDGYIKLYKGTDDKTKFYLKDDAQTVVDLKLPKKLMKTITVHKKDSGRIEIVDTDLATNKPTVGTVYNLLDKDFNILETKTTDYYGYLIFDNYYEYGNYYIEEVSVVDYEKNNEKIFVDLHDNVQLVEIFHGKPGSLKITNIDENGKKLDGVFEVLNDQGYVFDQNKMLLGTYNIKQISAEDGYIKDDNQYQINITRDNLNQELVIINKMQDGIINIINVDEYGNNLNGIFEVKNDGNIVEDLTKLRPGIYQIKQLSSKSGYLIDNNTYEVELTKTDLNKELVIVNRQIKGNIRVKITDEEGNQLQGSYIVYDKDDNRYDETSLIPATYYVKQTSTEEGYELDNLLHKVVVKLDDLEKELTIINKQIKGSITVNIVDEDNNKLTGSYTAYDKDNNEVNIKSLIPGVYYIKQISSKKGYTLDEIIHEVEVTLDDLNKELIIVNKQIKGSINIKITDEEGNQLQGGYVVYDKDDNRYDETSLVPGTYYVKQISTEEGYEIDNSSHKVVVKLDDLEKELTIVNKQIKGSITVNIVDEDGNKLTGSYTAYDKDNNEVNIKSLIPGVYYIKQISSKKGYTLDEIIHEVEITLDDLNKEFIIVNKQIKGSINIKITDEEGNQLQGSFIVYDKDENQYDETSLVPGTYYVKQLSTEEGYELDNSSHRVVVKLDDLEKELTIINKQIKGSITVNIVDEDGNKLTGSYTAYDKDNNEVNIKSLIPGVYYIKQISSKKGYTLDEIIHEVEVTLDDLNKELIIVNKQIKGSINVKITDEEGNQLQGGYVVYDKDDNRYDETSLVPGTYYVKQISTEEGYEIDNSSHKVVVKLDDLEKELTIVNKQIKGSITVNIVDEDGNKLTGSYTAYDKDNNEVNVKSLIPGVYYIKQTSVKKGYTMDETAYEVEITFNDLTKKITIVNKLITGSITINIVDGQGNKIGGDYIIFDEDGNYVDNSKLLPGTYYVRQIEVEKGYNIDKTIYEVTITIDDLEKELTIVNYLDEEIIPRTSSNNNIFIFPILLLIGLLLKRIKYLI